MAKGTDPKKRSDGEFEIEELDGDDLEGVAGGGCSGCDSCSGCSGTGCGGVCSSGGDLQQNV